MLRFNRFSRLTEAKNSQSLSSQLHSDDKGKLFELLLAKHLHPDKLLPSHHRSFSENPDHAGTPEQVHDKLRDKIGQDAYDEINSHASHAASKFKKHMVEFGHLKPDESIGDVHWTSNRDTEKKGGDHEKTTGIRDPNSMADLIITKRDASGKVTGHHGISAKYGEGKPNYKNPGMATMEKDSDSESGSFNKILSDHATDMEKLGYKGTVKERHAQYKQDLKDRAAGNKEAEERSRAAEDSSLKARTEIARRYAYGLGRKSDEELRNHIRNAVSPQTAIPHTIVHGQVQKDGSSVSHTVDNHHLADDHLNKFENLKVKHQGISAVIVGTHKGTGKESRVATIGVKASSGPHKGAAGTFSLR